VAVRVTVSSVKVAEQVSPQSMPAGSLVTVTPPEVFTGPEPVAGSSHVFSHSSPARKSSPFGPVRVTLVICNFAGPVLLIVRFPHGTGEAETSASGQAGAGSGATSIAGSPCSNVLIYTKGR
jgi:hypothetical protein